MTMFNKIRNKILNTFAPYELKPVGYAPYTQKAFDRKLKVERAITDKKRLAWFRYNFLNNEPVAIYITNIASSLVPYVIEHECVHFDQHISQNLKPLPMWTPKDFLAVQHLTESEACAFEGYKYIYDLKTHQLDEDDKVLKTEDTELTLFPALQIATGQTKKVTSENVKQTIQSLKKQLYIPGETEFLPKALELYSADPIIKYGSIDQGLNGLCAFADGAEDARKTNQIDFKEEAKDYPFSFKLNSQAVKSIINRHDRIYLDQNTLSLEKRLLQNFLTLDKSQNADLDRVCKRIKKSLTF